METLASFKDRNGYERWLRWMEWPLVILGLLFVLVLVLPLAATLNDIQQKLLDAVNALIWLIFVVDYVLRVYLTGDRRLFIRTHILDLIVIAVPFLRPFRLLRLLAIVISTSRRAGGLAVRRVTLYVVGVAVIIMSASAVVVYDAEKDVPLDQRTIKTVGDSFWWAIVTVTTVGYGDVYPTTLVGRGVAALLMITGIALIGTITAAVASWFVNIVRNASTSNNEDAEWAERTAVLNQVQALTETVNELRAEVRATVFKHPERATDLEKRRTGFGHGTSRIPRG